MARAAWLAAVSSTGVPGVKLTMYRSVPGRSAVSTGADGAASGVATVLAVVLEVVPELEVAMVFDPPLGLVSALDVAAGPVRARRDAPRTRTAAVTAVVGLRGVVLTGSTLGIRGGAEKGTIPYLAEIFPVENDIAVIRVGAQAGVGSMPSSEAVMRVTGLSRPIAARSGSPVVSTYPSASFTMTRQNWKPASTS